MRKDAVIEMARGLGPVAALRRSQAWIRVGMAGLLAVAFRLQLDLPVLWMWLAAYVGAQAFEQWAISAFLKPGAEPPRWRVAAALASMSVIAAAWGSLALLMWRLPGAVSAAGAVLLLCGGVLNVLTLSRGSAPAFAAAVWPYVALLAALPFSWPERGREPLAPALVMAALAFFGAAAVMWRDGEALRRREVEARRAADARRTEAEAAVAARAAFTAAVSHELRTPLSAILAASDALGVRALTPENRAAAGLIADGARLMRRLLDDLLDLSKLEAGRMAVEAAPFELPALMDETARFWAPEAAAKGVALEVHGLDRLPGPVTGDALRVRQVLNNLLSNAIKFTARGEVRLELDARATAGGGWRVRLAVADTGLGIEADAAERLFQPFEQAQASTARLHGGTGLGLSISRELARLMGGELTAEPRRDGPGARFALELPLAAARVAAPRPAAAAPAAAPARLLVVDDHPMGRQALSVLLGLRGCDVRLAEDGASALRLLGETAFDLVLTDLNLGALDGTALVGRLRAEPGPNRFTPVLAVTGEGRPEVLAAALARGVEAVVPKPVEPRVLYAAVDAALAGDPSAASAASRTESAASSFSSHSHTTATRQPAAASASQALASRAVLRAILDDQ